MQITKPNRIGKEKNLLLEIYFKSMNNNSEYLIDELFEKLKKYKIRKINLEKNEFRKFIIFLLNSK